MNMKTAPMIHIEGRSKGTLLRPDAESSLSQSSLLLSTVIPESPTTTEDVKLLAAVHIVSMLVVFPIVAVLLPLLYLLLCVRKRAMSKELRDIADIEVHKDVSYLPTTKWTGSGLV
jgi:hypothetical protein